VHGPYYFQTDGALKVDKVQDEAEGAHSCHVSAFQSQWQPSTVWTSGHVCGRSCRS